MIHQEIQWKVNHFFLHLRRWTSLFSYLAFEGDDVTTVMSCAQALRPIITSLIRGWEGTRLFLLLRYLPLPTGHQAPYFIVFLGAYGQEGR